MLGYKETFDKAAYKAKEIIDYTDIYPRFHDYPELFEFVMASKEMRYSDTEALELAEHLDNPTYNRLINLGPSRIGNGPHTLDLVESRHILLVTYLVSRLGKNWGTVIEIGGGYGNFFRLSKETASFDKWTIYDMSYIVNLQKWFINSFYPDIQNIEYRNSEEPIQPMTADLVIGTHSLSEFSWDDFNTYFEKIIKNSKRLFYATHMSNPSIDLLRKKLALIQEYFFLENLLQYEATNSVMFLFQNRGR